MMDDEMMRDRYRGALLGLAKGSAFGFLPENRSRRACVDFCQKWQRGERLPIHVRQHYGFGQITTDAQLALSSAEMLLEHGGLDRDDFIRRILERPKENALVACPASIRWMIFEARRGNRVDSHDDHVTATVRAIPIAMAFAGDVPRLLDATIEHTKHTHSHPDVVVSAALLGLSTSMALTVAPNNLDPMQFITSLRAVFFDISKNAFDLLGEMQEWIENDNDSQVVEFINSIGGRQAHRDNLSSTAFPAVLFGLLCFLRHPDSFTQAVVRAVSAGGATASVGCVAGALSGAYSGRASIESINIPAVETKKPLHARLDEIADGLFDFHANQYAGS